MEGTYFQWLTFVALPILLACAFPFIIYLEERKKIKQDKPVEVGCFDGVPFISFYDQKGEPGERQFYALTAENIDELINGLIEAKKGIR